ncbi:hypothetical protein QE152_g26391 [Popillia japonica]|uniref:Uncharacterized protein n=1 Tax=Popillia japonica TaxID=7064 RepID=A0AAW1JYZ0_POPJA
MQFLVLGNHEETGTGERFLSVLRKRTLLEYWRCSSRYIQLPDVDFGIPHKGRIDMTRTRVKNVEGGIEVERNVYAVKTRNSHTNLKDSPGFRRIAFPTS